MPPSRLPRKLSSCDDRCSISPASAWELSGGGVRGSPGPGGGGCLTTSHTCFQQGAPSCPPEPPTRTRPQGPSAQPETTSLVAQAAKNPPAMQETQV